MWKVPSKETFLATAVELAIEIITLWELDGIGFEKFHGTDLQTHVQKNPLTMLSYSTDFPLHVCGIFADSV